VKRLISTPGSLALCESVAAATTTVFCSESEAAATTKRPIGTKINNTLW